MMLTACALGIITCYQNGRRNSRSYCQSAVSVGESTDINASDKSARFVRRCIKFPRILQPPVDAQLPAGTNQEYGGIIRRRPENCTYATVTRCQGYNDYQKGLQWCLHRHV